MEAALQLTDIIDANGVRLCLALRTMFLGHVGRFRDDTPVRADILNPELIEDEEVGVYVLPEEILHSLLRVLCERSCEEVVRKPFRDGEFPEVASPREEVRMRKRPLFQVGEQFPA